MCGANCMLTAHDPDLAAALERHVKVLAGDIGERNVFQPDALHAAADYIEQQWSVHGCAVTRQDYQVRGVTCANIEVALAGCVQVAELIVLGAHYDTGRNRPGPADNPSAPPPPLALPAILHAL